MIIGLFYSSRPPSPNTIDSPSIQIDINRIDLLNLATDGTRDSLGRVHISEEAGGVLLNLLDAEAEAVVLASGGVDNTGDKAILGSADAADAAAGVLAVGDLHGVGEGDARGAGLALDGLVDVGGRDGGRLVLALEAGDGDVVSAVVGVVGVVAVDVTRETDALKATSTASSHAECASESQHGSNRHTRDALAAHGAVLMATWVDVSQDCVRQQ